MIIVKLPKETTITEREAAKDYFQKFFGDEKILIIREGVEIIFVNEGRKRCAYCGQLNDNVSLSCAFCGGAL